MVSLFYIVYLTLYSSPPQIDENNELSENVGVDDKITTKKQTVFKLKMIKTNKCSSSNYGKMMGGLCRA